MTRKLKILGIALGAVLALNAVAASTASAENGRFTAAVGSEVLSQIHGEQIGTDTFTISGLPSLTCTTAKETGFLEEGGVHKKGSESTWATFTPEYAGCHIVFLGITKSITVTVNNCIIRFQVLIPFGISFTIECKIEIHIYNNPAHTELLCTYDVEKQTVNNQITPTNQAGTPDDILAHINATVNVTNTTTGGLCGSTTNTTGVYKGTHTLRATNATSSFVNTTVS